MRLADAVRCAHYRTYAGKSGPLQKMVGRLFRKFSFNSNIKR